MTDPRRALEAARGLQGTDLLRALVDLAALPDLPPGLGADALALVHAQPAPETDTDRRWRCRALAEVASMPGGEPASAEAEALLATILDPVQRSGALAHTATSERRLREVEHELLPGDRAVVLATLACTHPHLADEAFAAIATLPERLPDRPNYSLSWALRRLWPAVADTEALRARWWAVVDGIADRFVASDARGIVTAKSVVERWVEVFNRADVDALAAMYAEDAVNHQVVDEPCVGRPAIAAMFRRAFEQAEMVCIPENIFESGEWAILEWRDPKGLRGCGFFHVVDGRIVFQRGYWDMLTFLRQHGLPLPTT